MPGRKLRLTAALVVAGSVVVALLPLVPLPIEDTDPPAFSSERAHALIEQLALEPHPMGSTENARVRRLIADELTSIGVEPVYQSTEAPDYFGGSGRTVEVVNVLGRLDGTDPTGAVAVVGHYDSDPSTPGANDNASAVAIMLEIARVLEEGPDLVNDVILLFTDGEEPAPRFGSQALVDAHPWFADIEVVVNLEALGSAGPSMLIALAGAERSVIEHYIEAVPRPAAFSFLTTASRLIGGSNTDFAPFRDAGMSGVEAAYLRGSSMYHTGADHPGDVGAWSLAQHGANTVALVEHLGNIELQSIDEGSEVVFFTVGPTIVVHHGASWYLVVVVLTGIVLAVIMRRTWRATVRSLPRLLLGVVVVMVGSAAVWYPLSGWRSSMRVVESTVHLVILAVAAVVVVDRLQRRRPEEPAAAALAWWVLAALLLPLPGIGYLFAWPAVAAAIVHAWRMSRADAVREWEKVTGLAIVALVTLVVMIPAIEVFFQFANPRPGNPDSQLPWMIVLPAFLIALSTQLIRSVWPTGRATLLPSALRVSRQSAHAEVLASDSSG